MSSSTNKAGTPQDFATGGNPPRAGWQGRKSPSAREPPVRSLRAGVRAGGAPQARLPSLRSARAPFDSRRLSGALPVRGIPKGFRVKRKEAIGGLFSFSLTSDRRESNPLHELGSSGNTGIRRSRYMSSPSATQIQGNPRAASCILGRCTTVAIYVVAFGDSNPR